MEKIRGEASPDLKFLNAEKDTNESLEQWALRLIKLAADADFDSDLEVTEMFLRVKFITGLNAGPLDDFFRPRIDIYKLSFKQILCLAFTTQARLDIVAKLTNIPDSYY